MQSTVPIKSPKFKVSDNLNVYLEIKPKQRSKVNGDWLTDSNEALTLNDVIVISSLIISYKAVGTNY